MNKPKVSIIISSYNRYDALMSAIASSKAQTYQNVEIIVVNDGSTDSRYYQNRTEGICWIDLAEDTRSLFGFPCLGYVRNIGIEHAKGKYVSFLDDDDYWLPNKLEAQVNILENTEHKICCSDALCGNGTYKPSKAYPRYLFHRHNASFLPSIFTKKLISYKNWIIHSSVVLEKSILDEVGLYQLSPLHGNSEFLVEDWDLWLRCLDATDIYYHSEALLYYDARYSPFMQAWLSLKLCSIWKSKEN